MQHGFAARDVVVGAMLTLVLFAASVASAADVPTLAEYEKTLTELVSTHRDRLMLRELGRSAGGAPIYAVTVRAQKDRDPRELLWVGGLEGDHPAGALIGLALVQELATSPRELPEDVRIIVVPCANPDAFARWSRTPLVPHPGNGSSTDDDRDWLTDEDGPSDLDGDGLVLRMRVRDPDGALIADAGEARLLRAADPKKGEVGEFIELAEGADDDGDGSINEDGPGGASPNRNFPQEFEEHVAGTGRYAVELPETRALVDHIIAHRRTALVVVASHFDNVTGEPETGDTPTGSPRKPATKLHPDDLAVHTLHSEAFREALGLETGGGKAKFPPGHIASYCYVQRGIPVLSHPLWKDAPKPEDAGDDDGDQKPDVHDSLKNDAAWLAHADANPALRGFVPWHPVKHPQHGLVEVGGFVPGFREIPPTADVERLARGSADYLARAAALLPRLEIVSVTDESRGGGFYRVETVVENSGETPLVIRQGSVSGRVRSSWISIDVGNGKLISGDPRRRQRTLAPGSRERFEWWIGSKKGAKVTIETLSTFGGDSTRTIELGARREVF